ncbi:MAG: hypothetical protein AB7N91_29485 [Candidatus Tectimicrobiota bacterium]
MQRVGFHISEKKEEAIFRGRQGAICIHAKLARRPRLPIKAPRRHMGLKRGLEGRNQLLKLVARQAGHIQEFRGTILEFITIKPLVAKA